MAMTAAIKAAIAFPNTARHPGKRIQISAHEIATLRALVARLSAVSAKGQE